MKVQALRPRLSKEALGISIVVRRRASGGAAPFGWEVHGADTAEPIHVSSERYVSMEAAYSAGMARLGEFLARRVRQAEVAERPFWQGGETDSGLADSVF